MNTSIVRVSVCAVVVGILACNANAVYMETVPVGNPGNDGELSGSGASGSGPDRICGSVGYTYNIGKYEVTAGQYTEFLNKVAKTDTYGLYSTYMDYDVNPNWYGCNIKRTGSPGNYSYSVAPDWANRPVNWVSWGDAARYSNWLSNGQPTGAQGTSTTEDGSYYLNGATSLLDLLAVTRKANATWAIPSEDEWYKAAYHKNDSVTGNYFDYPTANDSKPSNVLDPSGTNNANYFDYLGTGTSTYSIGNPYWRTEVGAFAGSDSPYGTFDQGGNVWEWNEATPFGQSRGLRGGTFSYGTGVDYLRAASRDYGYNPTYEHYVIGFRVSVVPEPATIVMLALAGVGIIRRRKA